MDILVRIRRLVLAGKMKFTDKAQAEMHRDGIDTIDVAEAIIGATFARGKISKSAARRHPREKVWVVEGFTGNGLLVYTKGVIRKFDNEEHFYVLISAKRSTTGSRE